MTNSTRTTGFVLALALAAALFVGSFVAATQYAASCLSWSERLGPAAPEIFALAQAINFVGALAAFAVLMAAVAGIRGNAVSTTHGSARWAEAKARG